MMLRRIINKIIDTKDTKKTPLEFLMDLKVRKMHYADSFAPNLAMHAVKLGADPNTKNSNGDSLLHLVVMYAYVNGGIGSDHIDSLINTYHAQIDIQDSHGKTPLQRLMDKKVRKSHYADSFNPRLALYLVGLGADPNTKNSNGDSLLHLLVMYAYVNGQVGYDFIKTLSMTPGAQMDIKDSHGKTPLQRLMEKKLGPSYQANSFDPNLAMYLVKLGADPNTEISNNSLLKLIRTYEYKYHYGADTYSSTLREIIRQNKLKSTALACSIFYGSLFSSQLAGLFQKEILEEIFLYALPTQVNSNEEETYLGNIHKMTMKRNEIISSKHGFFPQPENNSGSPASIRDNDALESGNILNIRG